MRRHYDVVVVGTGHGGAQAAALLRQRGFTGSIAMVGEEPEFPYERPPLSKEYLAGEKDFDRILLHPEGFWAEREISVITGRRVEGVDPERHRILAADGREIGYGRLIWAAGGHARRLACTGHDLAGVHTVRTRADVDQMARQLQNVHSVVVVGAGFVGLEAAAVLTTLGRKVVVVEALERVLCRVAGVALSRFYEAEHRRQGVQLHLQAAVHSIEGVNGVASGVRLQDGSVLAADMVIVGIGIVPSIEPLRAAGARCTNGVDVDGYGRTSLQDVFAIGDCALHPNPFADNRLVRLESVQNANGMAAVVVAAIMGEPQPYCAVPLFWSNQYDLRLQTVGLSLGYDAEVIRGNPESRSFSAIYLHQGRVVAMDCVNAVKDYVYGRSLVVNRARLSAAQVARASASATLKDMVEAG